MLTRIYEYKKIKMMEVLYADNAEMFLKEDTPTGVDIIRFYQTKIDYKDGFRPFYTLHIDLKEDEGDIFKKFKSNYRNEINKNMRDDNVLYTIVEDPTIEEAKELLSELISFSKFKGYHVNERLEMGRTKDFLKNLIITHVDINGQKMASHMYFVDGQSRARLRFSVSYRMDDSIDPKMVGRSNKGLHWFDIKELKKRDIAICDLGGAIRVDENGKILGGGISGFKKGFSDNLVTEYTGEIPLTIKGKLAVAVWKFLKNRRKS